MGQSSSDLYTTEVNQLQQERLHFEYSERIIVKAFKKCIVDKPDSSEKSSFTLTPEEAMCIQEYASTYGNFTRISAMQFKDLYAQMMRDTQAKIMNLHSGMAAARN
eukprot:Tbor_TRINITY_DN9140_c0_g1::TRINITY_DN9140_c0_g1_i1::g.14431::m.14431